MAWNDIMDSSSCITPTEWNDMVTHIEALGCFTKSEVTFYLYSDCSNSTGQKFKFDYDGDDSRLYGGDTSGQDLFLYSNSNNTYPFIQLEGNESIYLDVADDEEIIFREGGNQFFLFDHIDAVTSALYGPATDTHKLRVYANSNNPYPYLELIGSGQIRLQLDGGDEVAFMQGGVEFFLFDKSGSTSILYGSEGNGNNLDIIPNSGDGNGQIFLNVGSDFVKFGTHAAIGAETVTGYIIIKDAAGNGRKLAVVS